MINETEYYEKLAGELGEAFIAAVVSLRYFEQGGDSFDCLLYRLMQKADIFNFTKLITAFKAQAVAYKLWNLSPSSKIFYDKYLEGWIV